MKKFVFAALIASTLATPALAAPYQRQDNDHKGQQTQRWNDSRHDSRQLQNRRWNRGERFDYRQARNYRVLSNARQYHLRDAPRGYRWVQSGNDAVLIGITTGVIASVLANAIR